MATAETGYALVGWTGACSGPTCAVTMDAAKTVGATFIQQYTLTIDPLPVNGTVTGPGGLSCGTGGAVCSGRVQRGDGGQPRGDGGDGVRARGLDGGGVHRADVRGDDGRPQDGGSDVHPAAHPDDRSLAGERDGDGDLAGFSAGWAGRCAAAAFNAGTLVDLVATAETGYALLAWTGARAVGRRAR